MRMRRWYVRLELEHTPVQTFTDLRSVRREVEAATAMDALEWTVRDAKIAKGWTIQAIDIQARRDG